MVEEKDAEAKWCPFSRVMTPVGVGNRLPRNSRQNQGLADEIENAALCIGSSCMAWRWMNAEGSDEGYCGLIPLPPLIQLNS